MRFDIVFYLLGIICFILAVLVIRFFEVTLLPVAFLIVFLLFGLLFMVFGYSTRPKHYKTIMPSNSLETKMEEEPHQPLEMVKAPMAPKPSSSQQAPSEPSKQQIELNRIHGIGPKRVAAFNALQIMSVEDFVKFSAEELAEKLRIPSKITSKWVEQAKDLLKQGS